MIVPVLSKASGDPMPARSSRPPKYRHYKPKDLAVVRIDGKDHYLGAYNSPGSWEKYYRLLAEHAVQNAPAEAKLGAPSRTVADIILAFADHASKHYRLPDGMISDEVENLKVAIRPVRKLYGSTSAHDFGPLALRAVRDDMIASGLARRSINDRINRVRRMFRWAASVEFVPVAVVQALETVAGLQEGRSEARETDPIGPVALEVVEETLPHLSRPVAAMVRLQLLTGMRPGEVCGMRGCDLKQGLPNWTYEPGRHKTAWRGKKRVIPIGPKAQVLLAEFLTLDLAAHLFRPSAAVAEFHARRSGARKSRVTPSEESKRVARPGAKHADRYKRNTYLGAVARACDRAFPHPLLSAIKPSERTEEQAAELVAWRKARRWHPNQLRHTVGTDVRAKYGLEAAQTVLGHAKAYVTQVYAERDLAKAHDVIREIG